MSQKEMEKACQKTLERVLALARKPLLYGSLSSSQNTRRRKDGSIVKSAPFLTVSHGSEKGTVSKHVPRAQEASYVNRHQNTVAFREAVDTYIRQNSQLSDLAPVSESETEKKTR